MYKPANKEATSAPKIAGCIPGVDRRAFDGSRSRAGGLVEEGALMLEAVEWELMVVGGVQFDGGGR